MTLAALKAHIDEQLTQLRQDILQEVRDNHTSTLRCLGHVYAVCKKSLPEATASTSTAASTQAAFILATLVSTTSNSAQDIAVNADFTSNGQVKLGGSDIHTVTLDESKAALRKAVKAEPTHRGTKLVL